MRTVECHRRGPRLPETTPATAPHTTETCGMCHGHGYHELTTSTLRTESD